jgi:hypothetical protein
MRGLFELDPGGPQRCSLPPPERCFLIYRAGVASTNSIYDEPASKKNRSTQGRLYGGPEHELRKQNGDQSEFNR